MIILFYIIALNITILLLAYSLVTKHNKIVELENETTYYKSIIEELRNEITVNKAMNKN